MSSDRLYRSPDGRWLFGVRNFRGPALDIYDLDRGQALQPLISEGLVGNLWSAGTWSGGRFYSYVYGNEGSGNLWTISPDSLRLGAGVPVASFGQMPGCSEPISRSIVASDGNLFIYEEFGFKVDRRERCGAGTPGGAWEVNLGYSKKKKGTHLTDVQNAHMAVLDAAGLAFVLYDFRHTAATRWAERGMDMATLAKILGHANLRTVMRYVPPESGAR